MYRKPHVWQAHVWQAPVRPRMARERQNTPEAAVQFLLQRVAKVSLAQGPLLV